MTDLANRIKDIEDKKGKPISDKKKKFALVLASTGNKTQAAKEAGYSGKHVSSQAYKMAQDPEIQEMVEAISQYNTDLITEDFIKQGILKEALGADAPRDRLNAFQILAKSQGMLKDVVEQHDKTTDDQLIEEIRKKFGDEAAKKAEEDLGL